MLTIHDLLMLLTYVSLQVCSGLFWTGLVDSVLLAHEAPTLLESRL